MGNKTFLLLSAAGGLLAGFLIGSNLADDQPNSTGDASAQAIDQAKKLGDKPESKKTARATGSQADRSSPVISEHLPLPDEKTRKGKRTPRELREALLRAKDDPNPISRSAVFAEVLAQLNDENVDAVLEAYNDISFGFENAHDYRMLLYAWGQIDPLAAIEYSNKRAKGIGAGFAVAGVLEGWAGREPQAAMEWVNLPENAGMSKLYKFGLVKGWASQDLKGATAYVEAMEPGGNRPDLFRTITDERLRKGFEPSSRWAETLQDDDMKKSAFTRLAQQRSREHPEEVADWLKDHAGEDYAADAFSRLGDNWGNRSPAEAADYFDDLPAGKARTEGMREIVESWTSEDPTASEAWLSGHEPSPELDPVVAAYAREVSKVEGGEAGAMEWAVTITDPKLQEKTVTTVGQNWYRRDKDSAEAWLPASGLTEDMQNAIRKPPKQSWWQSLVPKKSN